MAFTVKALALPFNGLERQGQGKQSECHPPPAKKSRGLFSHYKSGAPFQRRVLAEDNPQQQLIDYIGKLTHPEFEEDMSISTVCAKFPQLKPLFEYVFCVPASYAPVKRVFSQSGLIMRPNRARMTDAMPETLVLLRCNNDI